ncbi:MAG TPA: cytidylate kinase-like family protein [Gemmatimonadaceae bacterium]|nr:cytidylate kinase-like family protein [Gemmatimonadaceae bacterium]
MSIITVSRMYGSGGAEVAERVAHALGWPLYDNAFVDAVAQRLDISPEEVEVREERVPPLVERLAGALSLATPEILPSPAGEPHPPREAQIAEVTTRVIQELVATGDDAVLVGRGAQSVLAARTDVIHVLCYAPHAALVALTAERQHISLKAAERLVKEINAQREQYVKQYLKRSWLALENYHLCLNTDALGLDGATEIIVRLAGKRFGRGGE